MNDEGLADTSTPDLLSLIVHYILFHGTPIANKESKQGQQNIDVWNRIASIVQDRIGEEAEGNVAVNLDLMIIKTFLYKHNIITLDEDLIDKYTVLKDQVHS